MLFSSVVLPAPRKPARTVMGITGRMLELLAGLEIEKGCRVPAQNRFLLLVCQEGERSDACDDVAKVVPREVGAHHYPFGPDRLDQTSCLLRVRPIHPARPDTRDELRTVE